MWLAHPFTDLRLLHLVGCLLASHVLAHQQIKPCRDQLLQ